MSMTSNVLDAVVGAARRSSAERARCTSRAALERLAADLPARPSAFADALAAPGARVIAECKRRSPSKGVLCVDYRPDRIAASYAAAGAAAISVLTEPTFFDGSLDHLRSVRAAVETPILRKDFVVTEYQVIEARAAGADAILLIVAALDDPAIRRLLRASTACGVAALVEAHDATEVQRAVDAGAEIVGVNSRDLRTLAVSPAVFETVVDRIPADVTAVAESGIQSPADVARLRALGYDAYLIGERFMATPDPGAALGMFLADEVRQWRR